MRSAHFWDLHQTLKLWYGFNAPDDRRIDLLTPNWRISAALTHQRHGRYKTDNQTHFSLLLFLLSMCELASVLCCSSLTEVWFIVKHQKVSSSFSCTHLLVNWSFSSDLSCDINILSGRAFLWSQDDWAWRKKPQRSFPVSGVTTWEQHQTAAWRWNRDDWLLSPLLGALVSSYERSQKPLT